jgi:hypothetical protein
MSSRRFGGKPMAFVTSGGMGMALLAIHAGSVTRGGFLPASAATFAMISPRVVISPPIT